jgi:hypothetical protein
MNREISVYALEMYRLGELESGDIKALEKTLAEEGLRSRLEKLDQSDRELRLRYPAEYFGLNRKQFHLTHHFNTQARAAFVGLAALIVVGVLLPILYIAFSRSAAKPQNVVKPHSETTIASAQPVDRVKGVVPAGSELSVYLKGDQETLLDNQALLSEGNTIQLAYTTPPGNDRYGVIFSIDGRSVITAHYPYRKGQSSLLVSGKRTFLDEAYTLDDAPGYEVFVMVVSDEPLDADAILRKARSLPVNSPVNVNFIEEKSKAMFEDCEVETVTVLKKSTTLP